jgi:hypothetical protein
MAFINKIVTALIIMAILISCNKTAPEEAILLDFESNAELDQLHWSCHTLYSLSDDHATHGSKSLKLDIFPSDYPGMNFVPAIKDWRDYKQLSFDVYNPLQESVTMTVRIDDKKDYPEYNDRYNKGFVLNRGNNHVVILLDSLLTSVANRHLNIAHIHRLFIFVGHPKVKLTLYVDAINLIKK